MSLERKTGRGWLAHAVNDNLTLSLSEIHPPTAEVEPSIADGGELRCILNVGHASVIMPLSVAEAVATALRFHQMSEWGDHEDAR